MKNAGYFLLILFLVKCMNIFGNQIHNLIGHEIIKPGSLNLNDTTIEGIEWASKVTWEDIKVLAKKERKYIFVDCYATWCGPCREMDKAVYKNNVVGDFYNNSFISVKVQMDRTSNDNDLHKSWYSVAKDFENQFGVTSFPTFLFFSPDGTLVLKEIGYKPVEEFVKLGKSAKEPFRLLLNEQLQAYKRGIRDYSVMKDLAIYVKKTLENDSLAKCIAVDYINNAMMKNEVTIDNIYFVRDLTNNHQLVDSLAKAYKSKCIDNFTEISMFSKDVIQFMSDFQHLIQPRDKFFELCYNHPKIPDSLLNWNGFSGQIVGYVIIRDEIYSKIYEDSGVLKSNIPSWNDLKVTIGKKYDKVNAEKIVLDFQVEYYRRIQPDWVKWSFYKNKRIKKYLPDPNNVFAFNMELNDAGAWDVFLNCNDKTVIINAISWMNIAIDTTQKMKPKRYYFAFLDTKANLLYKLGHVKKAIATQEQAIKQAKLWASEIGIERATNTVLGYIDVLNKMRKGEPTYVESGAIWDTSF